MPAYKITEDREAEVLDIDVTDLLHTFDGTPTFQAEAISDFLTHVDFSALFEASAVAEAAFVVEADDEEEDDEEEDDEEEDDEEEDDEEEDDEESVAEAMETVSEPQDMAKAKKGLEQAGVENIRKVRLSKDTRWPGAGKGVIWKKGRVVFIGDHPSLGLSVWHDQMGKPQGIQRHEFVESSVYAPGGVIAEHADMDDLVEMFLDYLDNLAENASTIAERASLTVFAEELLGEKAPFKKGGFKKMARKKVGKAQVARMLGAMLNKGIIKRVPAGTGYKGGDYMKDSGYKTGGKAAKQKKVEKFKKTNKSKLKSSARKARRRVKESEGAAGHLDLTEAPIFGLAVPFADTTFQVSVLESSLTTKVDESAETPAAATKPMPVINHAGSARSGPQLVVEALVHRGRTPAQEAPKEPISESAKLAANVVKGRMPLPQIDESTKLSEDARQPAVEDSGKSFGARLSESIAKTAKKS